VPRFTHSLCRYEPLDFVLFCPFHFFQNQQVFIVFSYSIVNVLFFALEILSYFLFSSLDPSSSPLTIRFQFPMSLTSVLWHLLSYHLNLLCQHIFWKIFLRLKIPIPITL